jgi:hypothetical protein
MSRPEASVKRGLIVAVLIFLAGAVAALASDAMTAPSPPRAVPPVQPTATSAPPGGRVTVPAPIDGLDVRVLETAPPRYVVDITAGLPSGCAQRDSHKVDRAGTVVTIAVLNSMPPGNPVCTMIYGTYQLSVDLGTDFVRGTTYTVRVNDKTTTFIAR